MDDNDGASEQKLIEKYLQEFALEDCLDEIMNQVVTERPKNPYTAISRLMELKTMPEIMDLKFYPVVLKGCYAVKAVLQTNIGPYHAVANYSTAVIEMKDYSLIENKLREDLFGVDPRKVKEIDALVAKVNGIESAECLAISMACCRVAAKMNDQRLYEYLATLFYGNGEVNSNKIPELRIPLPVTTIAVRYLTNVTDIVQTISIYPTKTTSLDQAMDKVNRFVTNLLSNLPMEKLLKPWRYSAQGTVCIECNSLEDLARTISAVMRSAPDHFADLHLGLSYQGEEILKAAEPAPNAASYTYNTESQGSSIVKSGHELTEQMMAIWQEVECIAVENPLATSDMAGIRFLKRRIQETIYDNKNAGDGGNRLKYCSKGIGGDPACNLQVILDGKRLPAMVQASGAANLMEFAQQVYTELPYNTIKISLHGVKNITELIDLMKMIKEIGSSSSSSGNNSNNTVIIVSGQSPVGGVGNINMPHQPWMDDFLVDLAIGMGASQLHLDGMMNGDVMTKFYRLQEIRKENTKLTIVGSKFHTGL